ncbi:ubiquitin-like small modifier protein 1 [Haladaptatus caseinilyticus]|uniref:ubiquitin-like small modifier protein 1 n=1 Tax=Haladaptatus caseinilyticus TaxID=2993314 RepID=UPI00224ABC05|nr:ubiquitin-like small modifier protein 1 [Haladaptatus caseinilyticus]
MHVRCHFFGPLREVVGEKTVEYNVTPETTVESLLTTIATDHPGLEKLLFEDEEIRDSMTITRNGTHVTYQDGPDTELEANDEIRVTPSIQGG